MGERYEQTLHKKRSPDGQKTHEKKYNIISQ